MATGDNHTVLETIDAAKKATTVAQNTLAAIKDQIEGKALSLVGTGNAALTAFTVAHGLTTSAGVAKAPKDVIGSPRNQVSSALHWFTYDTTNVTVNFAAAPASGANNVTFAIIALV